MLTDDLKLRATEAARYINRRVTEPMDGEPEIDTPLRLAIHALNEALLAAHVELVVLRAMAGFYPTPERLN